MYCTTALKNNQFYIYMKHFITWRANWSNSFANLNQMVISMNMNIFNKNHLRRLDL